MAIVALLACLPPAWALADCGDSSLYLQNDALSAEERCRLEAWAETHSSSALVVTVDGRPVFELVAEHSGEKVHVMSVTKSVASLAVGRMLLDGQLESVELELEFAELADPDRLREGDPLRFPELALVPGLCQREGAALHGGSER